MQVIGALNCNGLIAKVEPSTIRRCSVQAKDDVDFSCMSHVEHMMERMALNGGADADHLAHHHASNAVIEPNIYDETCITDEIDNPDKPELFLFW